MTQWELGLHKLFDLLKGVGGIADLLSKLFKIFYSYYYLSETLLHKFIAENGRQIDIKNTSLS